MKAFAAYVQQVIDYAKADFAKHQAGYMPRADEGGYAGDIFRMLIDYPSALTTKNKLFADAVRDIMHTEEFMALSTTCLTDHTAWGRGLVRDWHDLGEIGAMAGFDNAFFNIAANEAARIEWGQPSISADLTLPTKRYTSRVYTRGMQESVEVSPLPLRVIRDFTPGVNDMRARAGNALKTALGTRELCEALHRRSVEIFEATHAVGRVPAQRKACEQLRAAWSIPNVKQLHQIDGKLVEVMAPAGDGYIVGWELVARAMADIVWAQATTPVAA